MATCHAHCKDNRACMKNSRCPSTRDPEFDVALPRFSLWSMKDQAVGSLSSGFNMQAQANEAVHGQGVGVRVQTA